MMLRDEILSALASLDVLTTERQLDALITHASMMLATNAIHNLTRITDERDVAFLHVADSLTALPFLGSAPVGAFADLGSGSGYPGIPLAVVSGRACTLVESRSKKADFLREVVETLSVDAEVLGQRAEEVALERSRSFAAVTARALAPLPSLVELAAPLLVDEGLLLAMKGDPGADELDAGDRAAEIVGLVRAATNRFSLPGAAVRRTVVCYRRESAPRLRLPRRPGMAQRNPLA